MRSVQFYGIEGESKCKSFFLVKVMVLYCIVNNLEMFDSSSVRNVKVVLGQICRHGKG